jgi:hypothetical protein
MAKNYESLRERHIICFLSHLFDCQNICGEVLLVVCGNQFRKCYFQGIKYFKIALACLFLNTKLEEFYLMSILKGKDLKLKMWF